MLSKRQLEILLELFENPGQYTTAQNIAEKKNVSLRTIQSDMKQIRLTLESEDCVRLDAAARRGYCIYIQDAKEFHDLRDQLYIQFSGTATLNATDRSGELIRILISSRKPISVYDLETTMFVSPSTLQNDLSKANQLLEKFGLEIFRSQSKVMIEGPELQRRKALAELNLFSLHPEENDLQTRQMQQKIKTILVETLVASQYTITENALNNMILQLWIALDRIRSYFFILPDEIQLPSGIEEEREISANMMKKLEKVFNLRIPEEEIDFFALVLKAQANPEAESGISEEMDQFVFETLNMIFERTGIDLRDDLNARIALALHCSSLFVRIRYDMQLTNPLKDYIRQTFPQGYDLGILFSQAITEKQHKPVLEDETAFLAIILYTALSSIHTSRSGYKLLIVSSQRQSENILLRQTILRWFEGHIAELEICRAEDVKENDLEHFDVFATTEKNKLYDMGLAIYIHPFPNAQDYLNLKLALDGFSSLEDILDLFPEDLFMVLQSQDKQSALKELCHAANVKYDLPELEKEVLERENIGSTYFGNHIAGPHPMTAVSSDSFVSAGVFKEPIAWDQENHSVQLVLLIHIGKNNLKAFQLWNYLSVLFANPNFASSVAKMPTYESLKTRLACSLANNL